MNEIQVEFDLKTAAKSSCSRSTNGGPILNFTVVQIVMNMNKTCAGAV